MEPKIDAQSIRSDFEYSEIHRMPDHSSVIQAETLAISGTIREN